MTTNADILWKIVIRELFEGMVVFELPELYAAGGSKSDLGKGEHGPDPNTVRRWCKGAKNEGKLEAAKNFLSMGFPVDKVAKGTGLSREEVLALQAKNSD